MRLQRWTLAGARCAAPKWRRFLVAAVSVLTFSAVIAAATPSPAAAAAPGDLVWMQTWLPRSDFQKYPNLDVVRGPGGDLWLGVEGSTLSSASPYQKRLCVARYSPAGVARWRVMLKSPVNMDMYSGLAVDRWRNAILLGSRDSRGAMIVKVSPAGRRVWTKFLPSAFEVWSHRSGVAVDSAGNIYVVGTAARTATGDDVAVTKVSPAGAVKWTRYIDGYEGTNDWGAAIAVDAKNRIFVCGTVGGFFSGKDIMVARYSTTGGLVWKKTWDDSGGDDEAVDLAVSTSAFVISGSAKDSALSDRKGVVLKGESATGLMSQYVTSVVGSDLAWESVAMNAAGDAAAGGTAQYGGPSKAGTLVWPAAGAPVATIYDPADTAACYDVAVTPTGTLVGAGIEIIGGNTELQVMSDPLVGAGWRATVGLPGLQRCQSVVVTAGGIYVAGEAGDVIALWKFQP